MMERTVDIALPYLVEDVDRHGNVRVYFRHGGRKTRIRERVGSPEFMAVYTALRGQSGATPQAAARPGVRRVTPGTFGWLCQSYMAGQPFRALDPGTQRTRCLIIGHMLDEPVFPGSIKTFAEFPLAELTTKSLRVLRDRKEGLPEAANSRVRAIRAVYKWALADELIASNPARDLLKITNQTDGHHTWTADEVAAYQARHPLGTTARLALELLMYTGARRSDVVRIGRAHEKPGETGLELHFRPHKGRAKKNPVLVQIPLLPALAEVLAVSRTGDLAYLATEHGQPFTTAGFGNWFRDRCNEAGLTHCAAHGLRKAAATACADNGATAYQLMAIFGWKTLAQAELYTRAANRRKLAASGMTTLTWTKTGT